ncbi:MAG TPA: hypothetical protein VE091_05115 [Gemmatimonadales bacterium]|nr:hypothetical protein [Gemmatimonadales bacterium]
MAVLLGIAAAAYVLAFYGHQAQGTVSDVDALWVAARALRAGQDPYAAIQSPPWPWRVQYPLPAVLVMLPFSLLSLMAARMALMGSSVALLAYGLTRRAWWPLIMLAGGQMFFAIQSVQWTPLFAAAVLLPGLRVLWAIKPTTGLTLFAAYPNWLTVVGGVVLFALAFLLWPHWPDGWLAAVRTAPHRPAILRPGGVLLLLALLRWRLPEGRQLAVLALTPLSPHLYEALPLMLVARSRRELLGLALCGTVGLGAWAVTPHSVGPDHGLLSWAIVFLSGYLPALIVVLRHRGGPDLMLEPFTPLPHPQDGPGPGDSYLGPASLLPGEGDQRVSG